MTHIQITLQAKHHLKLPPEHTPTTKNLPSVQKQHYHPHTTSSPSTTNQKLPFLRPPLSCMSHETLMHYLRTVPETVQFTYSPVYWIYILIFKRSIFFSRIPKEFPSLILITISYRLRGRCCVYQFRLQLTAKYFYQPSFNWYNNYATGCWQSIYLVSQLKIIAKDNELVSKKLCFIHKDTISLFLNLKLKYCLLT